MGKKRKADYSGLEDVEQTLYHTFSTAANSISHLYTEGLKHQKRAYNAGARATTEKVLNFVLGEYSGSAHIPTGVLVEVLRRELEELADEGAALSTTHANPPVVSPGLGMLGMSHQGGGEPFAAKGARVGASGPYSSPMKTAGHPAGQLWQPQQQQGVMGMAAVSGAAGVGEQQHGQSCAEGGHGNMEEGMAMDGR